MSSYDSEWIVGISQASTLDRRTLARLLGDLKDLKLLCVSTKGWKPNHGFSMGFPWVFQTLFRCQDRLARERKMTSATEVENWDDDDFGPKNNDSSGKKQQLWVLHLVQNQWKSGLFGNIATFRPRLWSFRLLHSPGHAGQAGNQARTPLFHLRLSSFIFYSI